jgi:hypothetical protein
MSPIDMATPAWIKAIQTFSGTHPHWHPLGRGHSPALSAFAPTSKAGCLCLDGLFPPWTQAKERRPNIYWYSYFILLRRQVNKSKHALAGSCQPVPCYLLIHEQLTIWTLNSEALVSDFFLQEKGKSVEDTSIHRLKAVSSFLCQLGRWNNRKHLLEIPTIMNERI